MKFPRCFVCAALAASLLVTACKTTDSDKKRSENGNLQPKSKAADLRTTVRNNDVSFQAFVSRLRQAAKAHDANELAMMMTADFGYSIEPELSGAGVFDYWDKHNVWPELELVLGETFVVRKVGGGKEYMVAPAEFEADDANYAGYRAGITKESGNWKFAYFVSGGAAEEPAQNITPE